MGRKDICQLLKYKDTVNAIKLHCDGVEKYHPIQDRLGRNTGSPHYQRADLFRLITHSKMPEARRFETWLFERGTASNPPDGKLCPVLGHQGGRCGPAGCREGRGAAAMLKLIDECGVEFLQKLHKYYMLGLNYEEIGKLLDVSAGSVSSRVIQFQLTGVLGKRRLNGFRKIQLLSKRKRRNPS